MDIINDIIDVLNKNNKAENDINIVMFEKFKTTWDLFKKFIEKWSYLNIYDINVIIIGDNWWIEPKYAYEGSSYFLNGKSIYFVFRQKPNTNLLPLKVEFNLNDIASSNEILKPTMNCINEYIMNILIDKENICQNEFSMLTEFGYNESVAFLFIRKWYRETKTFFICSNYNKKLFKKIIDYLIKKLSNKKYEELENIVKKYPGWNYYIKIGELDFDKFLIDVDNEF